MPRPEKCLLAILGVHLVFVAWALGSMHVWSQAVSLGLAVLGFIVSLAPRGDPGAALLRLRRFPPFWCGLGLLLYITVQVLNPAWTYQRNATSWWLEGAAPISWLPAGIDSPFAGANPLREMMIYGTAWLVMCSTWIGLTRRRSLRILLGVLAANAVAIAGLLVLQQATGNTRMPWPLTGWTAHPLLGSFIYKNHAGAYLSLTAFTLLPLAVMGRDRRVRGGRKSSPAPVLLLAMILVGVAVVFTLSRTATVLLGCATVGAAGWLWLRNRRRAGSGEDPRVIWTLAALVGAFVIYVGASVDFSRALNRFGRVLERGATEYSVASREQARTAGWEMLADHPWRGVGAGGFRYLFPEYARHQPDIYDYNGRRLFWEFLHNDWLELPIELGILGLSFLVLAAGWWLRSLWRWRSRWTEPWTLVLVGCAQTLLHAWYDFPFQCPAILLTWICLLMVASRGFQIARRQAESSARRTATSAEAVVRG